MSPSFSISTPDDSRVSWVSFSRSRIISSTVMLPTLASAMFMRPSYALGLHRGDDDRPGWVVLDDHDAGAGLDGQVGVARVGVERLRASPHRHHDLAQTTGPDDAGDPAHLPDHP